MLAPEKPQPYFFFPDLSGESFELQWTTRQLTESYEKQLKIATGALLFVNKLSLIGPNFA